MKQLPTLPIVLIRSFALKMINKRGVRALYLSNTKPPVSYILFSSAVKSVSL